MIRHIVLIRFKDAGESLIQDIFTKLSQLTSKLDGARDFMGGRSTSPEQLERGFSHAFTIDFDSWSDLKVYADHPEHKALGKRIVDNAVGGLDGLIVMDLELR